MKIGPRPFVCTFSSAGTSAGLLGVPGLGTTMTYLMQTVGISMTSLPVACRGAYDKTFSLTGTFSSISNVSIDVTIDPQALVAPSTASWFSVGSLATPSFFLVHSGNIFAMRARTTAVSSSDAFGVVFAFDDAG